MADKTVEPWPLWGRVLAISLFVGFLVLMAVFAFRDGFELHRSAVTIYVSAFVVPTVLSLLVALVLRRRAEGLDTRFAGALTEAGAAVEGELRLPADRRPTGAPDEQLHRAARLLLEARRGLDSGSRASAVTAAEPLRELAASWQRDAPTSAAVRRVGDDARSLRRTVKALDQQR